MRTSLLIAALGALFPLSACGAASHTSRADVFSFAEGHWDWMNGDSTCAGNTHTITFSPDRREMLLTFREPLDSTTMERVARYRVLAAGPQIHPDLPYVIRAALEGETRTTDSGKLVVWDLILASPNRYHWHRTDWPDLGVTKAIVRCDGNRPLERWSPPAQQIANERLPWTHGRAHLAVVLFYSRGGSG